MSDRLDELSADEERELMGLWLSRLMFSGMVGWPEETRSFEEFRGARTVSWDVLDQLRMHPAHVHTLTAHGTKRARARCLDCQRDFKGSLAEVVREWNEHLPATEDRTSHSHNAGGGA